MRFQPVLFALLISMGSALAQVPATRPSTRPQRPIVLGPDDKAVFPLPPKGFDVARDGIAHGKLERVEYDSKTVGTRRKMLVYTPPDFSADKKYPAVYLLHGIGGDENEWNKYCAPNIILDNLYADGKITPMIVVFPNGRAETDDRPRGNIYTHFKAFENFTGDLIDDILPFMESHYPLIADRVHRALGGYSMGGGKTLNIGLTHLDTFAWLCGLSCAPNAKPIDQLIPDPAALSKLKLFYLACGDKDGLINLGQNWHAFLKKNDVPHTWQVNPGGHNGETWKLDLYHFSQLLFR